MSNFNSFLSPRPAFKSYPILDTQAMPLFEFVKLSGGNVVPMAAASDTPKGIAAERKDANDGKTRIGVYEPQTGDVFRAPLDAATSFVAGDTFAWSASGMLTKSTTNPIAEAVKPGTSQSYVDFQLLSPAKRAALALSALTDSTGGVTTTPDTLAAITNANNAGSADVLPTSAALAKLALKLNNILLALEA